jgi:hypothetical protein
MTTDLKPILTSSSIKAFTILQECYIFTIFPIFPIVVESGKASSGTQNED